MEQTKIHIRLDFAPLDVAVSLTVLTSGSPVTQTYNGDTGEYEPNRALTPTVIVPVVRLNAQDGSLTDAYGNSKLAQMVWYVDGEDISTLSDWAGYYEILTDGDERGGISITKNLTAGQSVTLHFEGVVTDERMNINYPIATEGIILSTLQMSEGGGYTMAIEDDTAIAYDPFCDRLFEYEYKVAHGIIPDTSEGRADATDKNAYLRTIPIKLYDGNGVYDGDYTVKVYEVKGWNGSELDVEEITITDDDDNEFDEISADKLVIDLRMVDKRDYLIRAFIDEAEAASLQFGITRIYTPYNVMSVNGASRKATDTIRQDRAQVTANSRLIEYPESVVRIIWKTDSAYLTGVEHNEGVETEYTIASTGAGSTYDDGWIDEYVETEHKGIHEVATSEDDEVYCDENGDTLIFN